MTTTDGEDREDSYLRETIDTTKGLIEHFEALPIEYTTNEEKVDLEARRKAVISDLKERLKELEEEVATL